MTEIKDEGLKECPNPWCDARAAFVWRHPHGFHAVSCAACEVSGPNKPSRAEAIAAWNTRQAEAKMEELLAEAHNALRVASRNMTEECKSALNGKAWAGDLLDRISAHLSHNPHADEGAE